MWKFRKNEDGSMSAFLPKKEDLAYKVYENLKKKARTISEIPGRYEFEINGRVVKLRWYSPDPMDRQYDGYIMSWSR